jgi:hypothetical protein
MRWSEIYHVATNRTLTRIALLFLCLGIVLEFSAMIDALRHLLNSTIVEKINQLLGSRVVPDIPPFAKISSFTHMLFCATLIFLPVRQVAIWLTPRQIRQFPSRERAHSAFVEANRREMELAEMVSKAYSSAATNEVAAAIPVATHNALSEIEKGIRRIFLGTEANNNNDHILSIADAYQNWSSYDKKFKFVRVLLFGSFLVLLLMVVAYAGARLTALITPWFID